MTVMVAPAIGQPGSIGIFSDPGGTDCNLADFVPGLVDYYFVHVGTPGATASVFSAPTPACMMATYVSTTCPGITLECDANTGISVGYGGCFSSPIHVATVTYLATGLTPPCCYYPVLPHPQVASGQIEVVVCGDNTLYATGGEGIVNSQVGCMCDVPAEPSTWGKVKALYID
jgi:hypothetical protein